MKRGRATYQSIAHGNANSEKHRDDVKMFKLLQDKKEKGRWVYHELADGKYAPFKSSFLQSSLGENGLPAGRNYRRVQTTLGGGSLELVEGQGWERELTESMKFYDHYHSPPNEKRKYWKTEKLRDRVLDAEGKEIGRYPASDIKRETIDLRPDHSRALQYMLASGRKGEVEQIMAEARALKIELFEEIYGRKVLFVGEHNDAGQAHDDLWHCGITITDENISKQKEPRYARERVPFRNYGVGSGTIAWIRHMEALADAGWDKGKIQELCAEVVKVVEWNKEKEELRHPKDGLRDVRLHRALDDFMNSKLAAVAPIDASRARTDYVAWLKRGYESRLLGLKKSAEQVVEEAKSSLAEKLEQAEELVREKSEREKELATELEGLKTLVATLEEKIEVKDVQIADKDAEISKQVGHLAFLLEESDKAKSDREKAVSLVDELVKAKEVAEAELAKERTLRERAEKALKDLKATVKSLISGMGHHFANALQLVPGMKTKAKEIAKEVEMTLPKAKDPTRPGNLG